MAKKKSAKDLSLKDQYDLARKDLRLSNEFLSLSAQDQKAMLDDLYKRYQEASTAEKEQKKAASLAQANQLAMAQQEIAAQRDAQKQQFSAKRLEQLKSIPSDLRGLEAMRKSNSLYSYGLGGSTPWTMKTFQNPQTGAFEKAPVLKSGYASGNTSQEGKYLFAVSNMGNPFPKKLVTVLPAGVYGKQEYRGLWEGKGDLGSDVIERPVKYTRGKGTSERDRSDQFYSPTGQPMGTLLGRGGYGGFGGGGPQSSQRNWSNYVAPVGPKNPNYYPQQRGLTPKSAPAPQPMPRPAISGPIGSTGFGERVATEEEEASGMFGGYFGSPFGRIQFPFANY